MRKLISLLLALVMVMGLATVAFADETTELVSEAFTADLDIVKLYEVVGNTDAELYPAETLSYTVTQVSGPVTSDPVTVTELEVTSNQSHELEINFPSYNTVGTYEYKIVEDGENTQGVTYSTDVINVKILVTYNYDEGKLDTKVVVSTPEGASAKDYNFTNKYSVGDLKVTKTVTGNLGDQEKKFDITVTFTAEKDVLSTITCSDGQTITADDWTDGTASVTVHLAHGEDVVFTDIPAGVNYAIEEADYTDGDKNGENGYDAPAYSNQTGTIAEDTEVTAGVTNNKATDISTGITMDSIPFVVMMVVCAAAAVLFVIKRRSTEF